MLKRREDEAMAVVGRIYENRTDVETELSGIRASVGAEKRTEWRELSQKSVRKMVIVGVAIAILGQFMGVNAVLTMARRFSATAVCRAATPCSTKCLSVRSIC